MDYKKLFLAVVGALTIMLVGFGFAAGVFYLAIHVPYVIGPLAALAIFYFITRSLYRSIRVEEKAPRDYRECEMKWHKIEYTSLYTGAITAACFDEMENNVPLILYGPDYVYLPTFKTAKGASKYIENETERQREFGYDGPFLTHYAKINLPEEK